MNKKHKITIPNPCHENWDEMTPNKTGRFCLSCSKTVVDFTLMLPKEIQHFFTQNQNDRICGRFRKSQLDTITIQIPSQVLYTQINYSRMFLLALFIAMGTTLFSCADKNGNKKKIENIEVVADTTKEKTVVLGMGLPPKHNPKDTIKQLTPSANTNNLKFTESKKNKDSKGNETKKEESLSSLKSGKVNSKKNTEEPVYNGGVAIETNAEFPGGIDRFYTFFEKEFKKPESSEATNIKIRLSFAVEKNGSTTYLQSEPAIDQPIEQEIIRILSLCPKWQPGEINGKKVRKLYSLPITLE